MARTGELQAGIDSWRNHVFRGASGGAIRHSNRESLAPSHLSHSCLGVRTEGSGIRRVGKPDQLPCCFIRQIKLNRALQSGRVRRRAARLSPTEVSRQPPLDDTLAHRDIADCLAGFGYLLSLAAFVSRYVNKLQTSRRPQTNAFANPMQSRFVGSRQIAQVGSDTSCNWKRSCSCLIPAAFEATGNPLS